jgi:hypothetical protein
MLATKSMASRFTPEAGRSHKQEVDRRDFLKGAVIGGAAVAGGTAAIAGLKSP